MSKRKRYGKQDAASRRSVVPSEKISRPNVESFNDEIDDFHNEREMVPLQNAKRLRRDSSDEEVYKVAIDSENDSEDHINADESDEIQNEANVIDSDIEDEADEENYLPSVNAWGRKKKDFYSTDYVDKDYGGNLSESDEEAAQLEEIEAKSLQRSLAGHLTEQDFELLTPKSKFDPTTPSHAANAEQVEEPIDLSSLSNDEKLRYLRKKHPEFVRLLQDFKEKKQTVDDQLKPIVESMAANIIPRTASLTLIQMRYEIYENYLLNVGFYLLLMAEQSPLKGHPVIDRIMEWRKLVDTIDEKCKRLAADDTALLLATLKRNDPAELAQLRFVDNDASSDVRTTPKPKACQNAENFDELYDFEAPDDEEDPKRAATYQILKNKGSTPHRKKEDRNPRVKHKRKYQKALHKKRSLVPDVRREMSKYDGEIRGIKPNVIKSVKLR